MREAAPRGKEEEGLCMFSDPRKQNRAFQKQEALMSAWGGETHVQYASSVRLTFPWHQELFETLIMRRTLSQIKRKACSPSHLNS